MEELDEYETGSAKDEDDPPVEDPPGACSSKPSLVDRGKNLLNRRRRDAPIQGDVEHGEVEPVQTPKVLRVHGVYMNERRHFSIRVNNEGRMELFDVLKAQVVR
jgi:hypothetical protein